MRVALLLLVACMVCQPAVLAQARITGPAPSVLSVSPPGPLQLARLAESDSAAPATHWKEGAIIGGLLGAVAGGLLSRAACDLSETTNCSIVPGILVGAALLGISGAL